MENYLKSLEERIVPRGLKLSNEPAFSPISENFKSKWYKVLWNAERDLVKLLLLQSDVVIEKITSKFQKILYDEHSKNFDQTHKWNSNSNL